MPPLDSVLCWHPACGEVNHPQNLAFCGRCGTQLRLADRYYAIRQLGQGGSGRTLLAIALPSPSATLDAMRVVVKQFSAPWLVQPGADPVGSALLSRVSATTSLCLPARMQTMLHCWQHLDPHSQIPALLDYFEQTGYFYLIQTYVPGENLTMVMASGQSFTPIAISYLLTGLLPVLHRMHTHGIIHRDIKPANIIWRPAITPESPAAYALVDWSTATSFVASDGTKVAADRIMVGAIEWGPMAIGSPEYTAPEQLRGWANPASDLYSLGVTCIHLLTGISPFALFDSLENRWLWRKFWPPEVTPRLSESRVAVLFNLLDRLIAPDLTQRFTSAAAALAALPAKPTPIVKIPPSPTPTWQVGQTLHGHQGLFAKVNAVAMAQATLASASDDRTIRLWELPSGKAVGVLTGHTHFVQAIAFAPQDSDILVSGSRDRTLKQWYWPESRVTHTLIGHTQAILTVCFTPDGRQIISGSADKTLKLWDRQTGELNRTLTGHRLAVTAIVVIPGQPTLIASASTDTTIKLWNLDTGALVQTLTGHTAAIRAIAISPNGTWLASSGEDRTIYLWNLVTQQRRELSGHSWPVSALRFMPAGETLVSGSWDHSLKLWHVDTGQLLQQLTGHTNSVSSLAIAPDARYIVSGSYDTTLKVWWRDR